MIWANAENEAKFWKERWVRLSLERIVLEWMETHGITEHNGGFAIRNKMNLWVAENAAQLAEFYEPDAEAEYGLPWLFEMVWEYGETAVQSNYTSAYKAFEYNCKHLSRLM